MRTAESNNLALAQGRLESSESPPGIRLPRVPSGWNTQYPNYYSATFIPSAVPSLVHKSLSWSFIVSHSQCNFFSTSSWSSNPGTNPNWHSFSVTLIRTQLLNAEETVTNCFYLGHTELLFFPWCSLFLVLLKNHKQKVQHQTPTNKATTELWIPFLQLGNRRHKCVGSFIIMKISGRGKTKRTQESPQNQRFQPLSASEATRKHITEGFCHTIYMSLLRQGDLSQKTEHSCLGIPYNCFRSSTETFLLPIHIQSKNTT